MDVAAEVKFLEVGLVDLEKKSPGVDQQHAGLESAEAIEAVVADGGRC